jgi:GNAT superfamily N-acetyltransferase
MTEQDGQRIVGFYTLSAYSVRFHDFPEDLRKMLPRYDTLPAFLIGRIAVDERYKGQRLGEKLLLDALQRCTLYREPIAALAVIVDAIDEKAASFYRRYDFQPFPNLPLKLFIRMKLLDSLFKARRM